MKQMKLLKGSTIAEIEKIADEINGAVRVIPSVVEKKYGVGYDLEYEPHICYKVHFKNGYVASIAKGAVTYGKEQDLWELALMKDGKFVDSYGECGIYGWLNDSEIIEKCKEIAEL